MTVIRVDCYVVGTLTTPMYQAKGLGGNSIMGAIQYDLNGGDVDRRGIEQ